MICGIDEAGRGPVIGPMVIAMICYTDDKEDILGKFIKRDSKGYAPSTREKLYRLSVKYLDYYRITIVTPSEINDWMAKGYKLNDLEIKKFSELIRDALNKFTNEKLKIYIDSPDVKPERARLKILYMIREVDRVEIICEHKADVKYLPVSVASIIAKVIRDDEIKRLHKVIGDFGSGYPSDPKTRYFIRGIKDRGEVWKYYNYIRIYWKTVSSDEESH